VKPWRDALHREEGWSRQLLSPTTWIVSAAFMVLVLGALVLPAVQKLKPQPHIVVYTSQDKVFAEAMFRLFTEETGIGVRAVFDSEAVKTVGLANRLLAEKRNPRCDVFWSNEELRTRQLAAQDVFDETTGWRPFGFRSRRLVINTNLVPIAEAPRRFQDLTNAVLRGRLAMAYPLFGTTCTHLLALRSRQSPEGWTAWCEGLMANRPMIVDGNSVVVRQVGRGEAAIGMTDSDDIAAGQSEGFPIAALPLAPDSLLIPNTAGLVRGGPNPVGGRQFVQWLTRPETAYRLAALNAIEGIDPDRVSGPTLVPNWQAMLRDLESATHALKQVFVR